MKTTDTRRTCPLIMFGDISCITVVYKPVLGHHSIHFIYIFTVEIMCVCVEDTYICSDFYFHLLALILLFLPITGLSFALQEMQEMAMLSFFLTCGCVLDVLPLHLSEKKVNKKPTPV